jgi:transposase
VNPPTIRYAYRDRNVIERAFNTVKHGRGLATRYDKHALTYRGALVLAAVDRRSG